MKVLMVEISQFVMAIYSSINTKKSAPKMKIPSSASEDILDKMVGFQSNS